MRKGTALAPALVATCLACTYDIPDLVAGDGAAPDEGGAAGKPEGGGEIGAEAGVEVGGGDASAGASEGGHPSDGASGQDAPCTGSLCACDNASSCASGICAVSVTVGAPLFAAAGMQFCTKPCCTSTDCDKGTVCYGSGQGGNYCVDPAWLGRSKPGSAQGGAVCSTGSDCRSGLCTAAKTCADTCCSFPGAGECATGSQCAFGNFPGAVSLDTHFTGRCGPPGGAGAFGAPCGGNGDCAGGLCFQQGGGGNCTRPCGTADECGGGNTCDFQVQGRDIYFACFPTQATAPMGAACMNDGQCIGDWCGSTSQCSNVCFSDSACSAVPGWHCLPQAINLPAGTYVMLVCGP
jgi:hypothetical protein